MDQFNAIHGNERTNAPREWNIQPPAVHFKSRTSPTKTCPVISDITSRISHHDIDNGYVKVHPSEYPF